MTAASIALPGHPDGPNNAERHRELILENFTPGRKRLSLMLTDDHHDYYKIPLGYDDTTAFNEDMSNPALKLVPVTFLRNIPDEGLGPLREGWVYIYVNGYLWREARYDTDCHMLIDVNLSYEKGLDRRRATVQKDSTLVLPWNMNGSESIVEIAFSEEQWSWERIDQLGGVDPEDPRQWLGERVETAYSTDYTAKARAARLMPVDLSAAESNFEDMPEDSNIRLVTNEELAPRRRHYNTKFDKGIASVILSDVIGDARYHATNQADTMALLDTTVNGLLNADQPYPRDWSIDRIASARTKHVQTVADSRLAVLLNNQFYAPIDQQLKRTDLADAQRQILEQRQQNQSLLDQALMETQLEKDACEIMIREALDDRQSLIELMDTPEFLASLEDFHCLENGHWFLLPDLMGQLITRLNQPVAFAYKDLFFNLDDYQIYLDRDLGSDLLLRLTGAHPDKAPHPMTDIFFPRSGPEAENPLSIDETEPSLEERLLNPVKVRRIIDGLNDMDYLNWPPLIINGSEVDLHDFANEAIKSFTLSLTLMPGIESPEGSGNPDAETQAWRFAGHTAHAFGAVLSGQNYEDVKAAQSNEMEWGSEQQRRQQDQAKLQADIAGAKIRQQELQVKQQEYAADISDTEQALTEAEQRQRQFEVEKNRLLDNRHESDLLRENTGMRTRIDQVNDELSYLDTQLKSERARLVETKAEHRQVSEALNNINTRVQAMEASTGKVLSNFTLKHNTKVVSLYALLAGEHLQTLKITHDDLLYNRIPSGYLPFSAAGTVQRLKARLRTAQHIAQYQGPWVNFEISPAQKIRVPADLAFENVDELHQYFADFLHDSFMVAEDVNAERINLIVASQETLAETRAQAKATIVDNEETLRQAKEAFQEKLTSAKAEIERLENGKYRYQGMLSETKKEAESLAEMLIGTERKIATLQTQIDDYETLLDNSRPNLSFSGRMSKLLLLSGGMVVFEAWNLSSMTEKLSSDYRDVRGWIDFSSALADFAATIVGSAQYIMESKYGNWKVVESRLKNITHEQFIRSYPLTEKSATWVLRFYNFAGWLNLGAGVLGAVISLIDAYNRWVMGDRDAAAAYGVVTVGFALTAASSIRALAPISARLGLVGFGLVVIGYVLVYFLEDKTLETLLKNCSFGREPAKRYGGTNFLNDDTHAHWRERRDLAYHSCISQLLQPSVHFLSTCQEDENFCEITIRTPGLAAEGTYQFDIQAWQDRNDQWETVTLVTNASGSAISADPGSVQVKADGVMHQIRLRKDLIKSFNSQDHYGIASSTVQTKMRVRVQLYPLGEAARLFPGAPTTYVLPAPERNSDGYPIVNGDVVDESTATEHAWLVTEGEVTHVVHRNSGYSSNWGITPEDLQNAWPQGQ